MTPPGSDLINAASLKWDDYEDAVQAVIAKRIDADYIITRTKKDYMSFDIKAITPSDFMSKL